MIKGQETRTFTTTVKDLEGARLALINLSDLGLISFVAENDGTSVAELDTQFTTTYDIGTSTVASVGGTAPIVSSGGVNPLISIDAATTSDPGSMSAADKTIVDGLASGYTEVLVTVTGDVVLPSDMLPGSLEIWGMPSSGGGGKGGTGGNGSNTAGAGAGGGGGGWWRWRWRWRWYKR